MAQLESCVGDHNRINKAELLGEVDQRPCRRGNRNALPFADVVSFQHSSMGAHANAIDDTPGRGSDVRANLRERRQPPSVHLCRRTVTDNSRAVRDRSERTSSRGQVERSLLVERCAAVEPHAPKWSRPAFRSKLVGGHAACEGSLRGQRIGVLHPRLWLHKTCRFTPLPGAVDESHPASTLLTAD